MKKTVIQLKIKQRAPRSQIQQKSKIQNISRKVYKRDKSWKNTSLDQHPA